MRSSLVGVCVWVPTTTLTRPSRKWPEGLFLARRFGVEVDNDGVRAGLEPAGGDLAVDGAEGAVDLGHEDAAHGVDDEYFGAVVRFEQRGAAAGRAGREVDRPDQAVLALDVDERVLLVEGVITQRDGVGAGVDQLEVDALGDAEAAGGVLTIDDQEIEIVALAQAGDRLDGGLAARTPYDVAEESRRIRPFRACGCRRS